MTSVLSQRPTNPSRSRTLQIKYRKSKSVLTAKAASERKGSKLSTVFLFLPFRSASPAEWGACAVATVTHSRTHEANFLITVGDLWIWFVAQCVSRKQGVQKGQELARGLCTSVCLFVVQNNPTNRQSVHRTVLLTRRVTLGRRPRRLVQERGTIFKSCWNWQRTIIMRRSS